MDKPTTTELGAQTEEKFAAAYVAMKNRNAAKAAESIGLSQAYGKKLLQRPKVKEYIRAYVGWQVEQLQANSLAVLQEAWACSRSNIYEIVTVSPDGFIFKRELDVPVYAQKAVKKLVFEREESDTDDGKGKSTHKVKIKMQVEMHDKGANQTLLAKHLDLLNAGKNSGVAGLAEFLKARMAAADDPLE